MLGNIFTVFMAILFYFICKMLYNIIILIVIANIIKRLKEKGEQTINQFREGVKEDDNV